MLKRKHRMKTFAVTGNVKPDHWDMYWIDREREPTQPPNPDYPNGIEMDMSDGQKSCESVLPYPAPRCGMFYIDCKRCGTNAMITTAGRIDDPRSVKLKCKLS